jgi:hypothetical protein
MPGVYLLLAFLLLVAPESSTTDDIREAVFRYQMQQLKASVYYLAFGNTRKGADFLPPSEKFMKRFEGQPEVKPYLGEAFIKSFDAVILSVDGVERDKNKAEVAARFVFLEMNKRSAAGFYDLEFKNGSWRVVGKKAMKIIPVPQRLSDNLPLATKIIQRRCRPGLATVHAFLLPLVCHHSKQEFDPPFARLKNGEK